MAGVLAALAALATAAVVVPRAAAVVHSRIAYGTWDPAAQPERIDYCGRRYDLGRAGLVGAPPPDIPGSWRQVGTTDAGTPYYALVLTDAERRRVSPPTPCTMMLYLRAGPDAYVGYPLSGGP